MYDNRRWLVIPTSLTGSINFDEVLETSANTLRISNDGAETFVKYDITVVTSSYDSYYPDADNPGTFHTSSVAAGTYGRPSFYSDSYTEYTYSEILTYLSGSNWKEQNT